MKNLPQKCILRKFFTSINNGSDLLLQHVVLEKQLFTKYELKNINNEQQLIFKQVLNRET